MPYLSIVFPILISVTVILVMRGLRYKTDTLPVDNRRLVELLNDWKGPQELVAAPSPRPVRWTTSGKTMIAIGVIVLAVFSVLIVFVIGPKIQRQRQREALLSQESAGTLGIVIRTWTASGGRSSRTYHVAYQYAVNDRMYQSEAEVRSNMYSHLAVYSKVRLRYAPSHPEVSKLDGEVVVPSWLMLIGFIPFVAIGVLPYAILKQKRLLEWGQPAGGIVTRVAPTKGGKSVSYQYLDFAGNMIKGSVTMKSSDAPSIGKTVTVLYDRDKPKRSMVYPAQFVRLANPFG